MRPLPANPTELDFVEGVDPQIQHGDKGWDRVEAICKGLKGDAEVCKKRGRQ